MHVINPVVRVILSSTQDLFNIGIKILYQVQNDTVLWHVINHVVGAIPNLNNVILNLIQDLLYIVQDPGSMAGMT